MPFKTPKGDIRWWSYLWLLCGVVLVIYGPIKNDFSLAIAGVIAIVIVLSSGLIKSGLPLGCWLATDLAPYCDWSA